MQASWLYHSSQLMTSLKRAQLRQQAKSRQIEGESTNGNAKQLAKKKNWIHIFSSQRIKRGVFQSTKRTWEVSWAKRTKHKFGPIKKRALRWSLAEITERSWLSIVRLFITKTMNSCRSEENNCTIMVVKHSCVNEIVD